MVCTCNTPAPFSRPSGAIVCAKCGGIVKPHATAPPPKP